jgi:hypothetical protein
MCICTETAATKIYEEKSMAASKGNGDGEMYEVLLPYYLGFRWRR